MKKNILILMLFILMSACQPQVAQEAVDEGAVQTAIAQTEAAEPTNTALPPTETTVPTVTEVPRPKRLPTHPCRREYYSATILTVRSCRTGRSRTKSRTLEHF